MILKIEEFPSSFPSFSLKVDWSRGRG